MQLYRIEYDQLTLISTFDDKGRKTGEREHRARVSMSDLPLQTAQMYRNKMTGLNFKMELQPASRDERPRTSKHDRRAYEDTSKQRAAARPSQPSKQEQINKAAATGDMTAAINQRSAK